jgi:hypothetical protein
MKWTDDLFTKRNGYVYQMTDKNIQYPNPKRATNTSEQTTNSKKKGNDPNDDGDHIASNESVNKLIIGV